MIVWKIVRVVNDDYEIKLQKQVEHSSIGRLNVNRMNRNILKFESHLYDLQNFL